jgi:plasmid stability protein
MPTTLTLKNVPDEVYERLKAAAARNRRSLNREAILVLETALAPGQVSMAERLGRARALRAALPARARISAAGIDAAKRAGRP